MTYVDIGKFDPLANGGNKPKHPPGHSSTSQSVPALGLDTNQVRFLEQQGFSSGLIRALDASRHSHPRRIWILDNSMSMNVRDSHRISGNFTNLQNIPATRWEELQDCVAYHAQISALFHMPTRFALVNNPGSAGPQYFGVAENNCSTSQEVQTLKAVMTKVQPGGPTLLSEQIAKLRQYIVSIAPTLKNGQTITIVLATQGLPTNEMGQSGPSIVQHFVQTLRSLEGLPVWIVIRLCTDEEQVFDFYNSLDSQANLPCDVLDDFFGESLEIYLRNPWLTYALPLHRFRELGSRISALDAIDERELTTTEVRDLCCLLFSIDPSTLPDPTRSWDAFFQVISGVVAGEKHQWNPVTRKLSPWINLHDLNNIYGVKKTSPHPQFPLFHHHQQPIYQEYLGVQNPTVASTHSAPQPHQSIPVQQPQRPLGGKPYHQSHIHQQPPSQPYANVQSAQQQQKKTPPRPTDTAYQPSHQQQQPVPPSTATGTGYVGTGASVQTSTNIADVKKQILTSWALAPPQYTSLRPIDYLLGTVHQTFPPSFGIEPHEYFQKWKPFSLDALSSRQEAVLKRAVRKMKVFLHPDRLPKDLTEKQTLLCKILWDVTADAWEAFGKS